MGYHVKCPWCNGVTSFTNDPHDSHHTHMKSKVKTPPHGFRRIQFCCDCGKMMAYRNSGIALQDGMAFLATRLTPKEAAWIRQTKGVVAFINTARKLYGFKPFRGPDIRGFKAGR